jgi:hypothetical protein
MQEEDSRNRGYFSNDLDFSDSLNSGEEILNTSTKVTDDSESQKTQKNQKRQKSVSYADTLPYTDTLLLPFKEFIAEASYLSREEADEKRDSSGENWQLETWLFARMCKARSEFKGLNSMQAVKRINWRLQCSRT